MPSATAAARSLTPQLLEQALHVRLHGGRADEQAVPDLRRGQPLGDQPQDLRLARGQDRCLLAVMGAQLVGHAGLDLGGQHGGPAAHGDDRVADPGQGGRLGQEPGHGQGGRLGQEPGHAQPDGLVDERARVVRGQDQHARRQRVALDRLEDPDPIERRKLLVDHRHAGLGATDLIEPLASVSRAPDELEIRSFPDRADDRLEEHRVIVGHQHRDSLGGRSHRAGV
jgi:hypothetical protein